MITVSLAGPLLKHNAGYLDHRLILGLTFVDKSILWTPRAIYAVSYPEIVFRIAQFDQKLRKAKYLVLWTYLSLKEARNVASGLYVPADDVYPFDGLARIDYELTHLASIQICEKHQDSDDPSLTLWERS